MKPKYIVIIILNSLLLGQVHISLGIFGIFSYRFTFILENKEIGMNADKCIAQIYRISPKSPTKRMAIRDRSS